MYRKLSSIVIVLILALCSAGGANALPLDREAAEAPGRPGLLGGIWNWILDWLDRMAGGEDDLAFTWMEGCHIDPNGSCGPH